MVGVADRGDAVVAVAEESVEQLHLCVGGVLEFVEEHHGETFFIRCRDVRKTCQRYGVFDEVTEVEQRLFTLEGLVAPSEVGDDCFDAQEVDEWARPFCFPCGAEG